MRSLHSFLGAKASASWALPWASCRSVSNACATACATAYCNGAQHSCNATHSLQVFCAQCQVCEALAESFCNTCCCCVTGVQPKRHWLVSSLELVHLLFTPDCCNFHQISRLRNGHAQSSLISEICDDLRCAFSTQNLCSSYLLVPSCRPTANKKQLQLHHNWHWVHCCRQGSMPVPECL